jgi:hypothetical protein
MHVIDLDVHLLQLMLATKSIPFALPDLYSDSQLYYYLILYLMNSFCTYLL